MEKHHLKRPIKHQHRTCQQPLKLNTSCVKHVEIFIYFYLYKPTSMKKSILKDETLLWISYATLLEKFTQIQLSFWAHISKQLRKPTRFSETMKQWWISSENYYTRPRRWNFGCSTNASRKAATTKVKLNLVGKQWNVRMKSSFRGEKFSCTSKRILPTPVTNCASSFCTLLPGLQQNISLFPVKEGVKKNKSLKKNSQGETLVLQEFLGWLSSPTHPQFKEAKIKFRRFNSTQGCGLHTSIFLI